MNNSRRKELDSVVNALGNVKSSDDLQACIDELERIKEDEEYYFDSIPENLQGSMRGMASEEAIENMDSALDSLNEALDADDEERDEYIEEAIDLIEEACI